MHTATTFYRNHNHVGAMCQHTGLNRMRLMEKWMSRVCTFMHFLAMFYPVNVDMCSLETFFKAWIQI